jgi:RNA processing factor Prp31
MSSADDVRMSEKPVPETLETIAAKIDALNTSVDRRFDETRAQLGVKIEAVDTKVTQIYDEVIAMREEAKRNAAEHKTFTKRLNNHDVRILALEKPGPTKS